MCRKHRFKKMEKYQPRTHSCFVSAIYDSRENRKIEERARSTDRERERETTVCQTDAAFNTPAEGK